MPVDAGGAVAVPEGVPELEATDDLRDPEAAFERAYDREFPHVYRYIRYRVGAADTADDLTSLTFLKALDRLGSFDPARGEMGRWILGIARNVVRDHLRGRRRWRWLPSEWLSERVCPDQGPEQRALSGEEHRRLLDAIAALPDRERDVLGLKFGAGLTNRAIAGVTGLGESHVGVIVYRAVGRLRARLDGEEVRRA